MMLIVSQVTTATIAPVLSSSDLVRFAAMLLLAPQDFARMVFVAAGRVPARVSAALRLQENVRWLLQVNRGAACATAICAMERRIVQSCAPALLIVPLGTSALPGTAARPSGN